MNKSANLIKRCASLCIAATMFLAPVKAWALDLDLVNGAITFGGDSNAGTTNYSQGSVSAESYTGTATVTGDYSGDGTAITVNGGNHTIVVDDVSFTPATPDSSDPVIKITGGEQYVSLENNTFIDAGENGAAIEIDGGEHIVVLDDFAINGASDATGIEVKGGADLTLLLQSDSGVYTNNSAMVINDGSSVKVGHGLTTETPRLTLSSEKSDSATVTGDNTGKLGLNKNSIADVLIQHSGGGTLVENVTLEAGNVRNVITESDGVSVESVRLYHAGCSYSI